MSESDPDIIVESLAPQSTDSCPPSLPCTLNTWPCLWSKLHWLFYNLLILHNSGCLLLLLNTSKCHCQYSVCTVCFIVWMISPCKIKIKSHHLHSLLTDEYSPWICFSLLVITNSISQHNKTTMCLAQSQYDHWPEWLTQNCWCHHLIDIFHSIRCR